MTNGLLIHIWGNICAFPHILGSPSSYMTLQLLNSEFPCIWGKFYFLFYQCGGRGTLAGERGVGRVPISTRNCGTVLFIFFWLFLWRARVCRPLLCLCRQFMIFEGCLDSNPECCRSTLARYRLRHPTIYSLYLCTLWTDLIIELTITYSSIKEWRTNLSRILNSVLIMLLIESGSPILQVGISAE